jgi:tripartite-type tricarboxylate transporter receptor subunit TctC
LKTERKKPFNIFLLASAFTFLHSLFCGLSFGAFPVKPITLIVPWAAGGPADLVWRGLAEPTGKILGQPVIVTNKPGGSGALGAVLVKNAAPDGYTIGHASTSNHLMNPYLFDAGYEMKDFTYIYDTVGFPLCLVVRADAPWKTYQELIDYVKANPMKVRMGYYGPTGVNPVAMKWVAKKEGLQFKEVLYKGDSPGLPALLGNHIDAFCSAGALVIQVKSGQLRMLLSFTSKPIKGFEDIPSFGKVYGKVIDSTMGLVGPKGLPPEVVAKIEDAVAKGMKEPSFAKLADSMGAVIINRNHKEFTSYIVGTDKIMKEWLDELGLSQTSK